MDCIKKSEQRTDTIIIVLVLAGNSVLWCRQKKGLQKEGACQVRKKKNIGMYTQRKESEQGDCTDVETG